MTTEGMESALSSLGVQLYSFMRESLEVKEEEMLESQRLQLFQGKDMYGNDIHPFYSEDLKPNGYFKSAESAARYAAKKAEMSYPVSASRNLDAPNLYYAEGVGAGRFHSELTILFDEEGFEVVGSSHYSEGIIDKYPTEVFGISEENMDNLMPYLIESMQTKLKQWIES